MLHKESYSSGACRRPGRSGGWPESVDLTRVTGPVGLAKLSLQDLAARIAGDRLDEVHRTRPLEAGKPFARPVDQVLIGQLGPGLADDDGFDRLTPAVVRHTDHGNVGHGRMVGKDALQLSRVDVLTPGDDHVLDPVADVEEAVSIHAAGVARVQPAPPDRTGGVFGAPPVALHDSNAAVDDLTDVAGRHLVVQRVDHPDLGAE